LHGLQLYVNQFWLDHLLSYCTILSQRQKQLPHELASQLIELLCFSKEWINDEQSANHTPPKGLEVLDQHPKVRAFIIIVKQFRDRLENDDLYKNSIKSASGMNISFKMPWNKTDPR
jgi:hypothetical protein